MMELFRSGQQDPGPDLFPPLTREAARPQFRPLAASPAMAGNPYQA